AGDQSFAGTPQSRRGRAGNSLLGVLAKMVERLLDAQQFAGQIAQHESEKDDRKLLEDLQKTSVYRLPGRAQTGVNGEGAQENFQRGLVGEGRLFAGRQPDNPSQQNRCRVQDGAGHASELKHGRAQVQRAKCRPPKWAHIETTTAGPRTVPPAWPKPLRRGEGPVRSSIAGGKARE